MRRSQLLLLVFGLVLGLCLAPGCEDATEPPPAGPVPAASPESLVAQLADAYQRLDLALYTSLFPSPADSLAFSFCFEGFQGTCWDRTEELRIHRRMFTPLDTLPGETPVYEELRPQSLRVQLERLNEWTERADLYRSDSNPSGLDPERWRVTGARYRYLLTVELQGETDYLSDGESDFVVAENRLALAGSSGKWVLYRWVDYEWPTHSAIAVPPIRWAMIKGLYR